MDELDEVSGIKCLVCTKKVFDNTQEGIVHHCAHNVVRHGWPAVKSDETDIERHMFVDRLKLSLSDFLGGPWGVIPNAMVADLARAINADGPTPVSPIRMLFDKHMTVNDIPFQSRRKLKTMLMLMDALMAYAFRNMAEWPDDESLPETIGRRGKRGRPSVAERVYD